MFSTLNELLFAQAAATAIILLVFGLMLARRNLFRWTTAGFWAWAAFALYFLINPLASIRWNIERYHLRLSLSGGLARGEWILLVSAIGMVAFFVAYLASRSRPITWQLPVKEFKYSFPMVLVMAGFIGLAGCSLLIYRTRLLAGGSGLSIEDGRFTGDTTGYEYMGHTFLFVPVALLLLSPTRWQRRLGWLIAGAYVILSLPDEWARFTIVSMLVAISLADTVRRDRTRPRLALIIVAVLFAAVLQLRGHSSINSSDEFYELVQQVPDKMGSILAASDTSMLASWYLRSYVSDSITGYDYGIPFINYALFGIIPNRLFPQKYFLVDWLRSTQPDIYDPLILSTLYGAKISLPGKFYSNGGIIAVLLEMSLTGFLCRRMDGMLAPESPRLVKATAVSWMSMLWIIWGSGDTWALVRIGSMLIPALVLWALTPKSPVTVVPAYIGPTRSDPIARPHYLSRKPKVSSREHTGG
jgi:hypothetical protein